MSKSNKSNTSVKGAPKSSTKKGAVAPVVAAPAPAPVAPVTPRDVSGVRVTSRGFTIDTVLIAAGAAGLTMREITAQTHTHALGLAYEKREGQKIAAISNHVAHLVRKGHVVYDAESGRYSVKGAEKKAPKKAPKK